MPGPRRGAADPARRRGSTGHRGGHAGDRPRPADAPARGTSGAGLSGALGQVLHGRRLRKPHRRQCLQPYADPPGNAPCMFGAEQTEALFTALDAARFAIHVHVIGDAAARRAIEGLEAARAATALGPRSTSWRICNWLTLPISPGCEGLPRPTSSRFGRATTRTSRYRAGHDRAEALADVYAFRRCSTPGPTGACRRTGRSAASTRSKSSKPRSPAGPPGRQASGALLCQPGTHHRGMRSRATR
jgi:hypothetical protein